MQLLFSLDEEYKKDELLKVEDVKSLQEWAKKQSHLPDISEHQLVLFLQSCYFRLEPAKVAIEKYFTIRTHMPEIFQSRALKRAITAANVVLVNELPSKTPEGYTVSFSRYVNFDPEQYIYIDTMLLFDMVTSIGRTLNGTSKGFVLILDAEKITFSHFMKVNLMVAKKFLFYVQEALPVRIKAIHIINTAPIVDKIISVFKPFINVKIFDLIQVHSRMDTLYKFIPQEIMPREFGGKAGSLAELNKKVIETLTKHEDFFREEEKQLVDETRRVGQYKYLNDIANIGVEGSFKKLNFD